MIEFSFEQFKDEVMPQIGQYLKEKAQHKMGVVSNGRAYVIGGKTHIASRAGDSPNNLSGELKNTIGYEVDGNILEFGAGNETINYAKYLEKGTQRIKIRPNYTKTILESENDINKLIQYSFRRHMGFKNV